MQNLKNIGTVLTKEQQKKIAGGKLMYKQTGWTMSGGQCYCDFTYTYSNGSTVTACDTPCNNVCCSSANSCVMIA